ncbi:porin family protein [Ferruginibacter sp. SUN002]|uniref:porin family protein n=1 Tax=Ferruginibacter sp. SUN002 TaxID=2937789 RepID=UPI003D35B3D9
MKFLIAFALCAITTLNSFAQRNKVDDLDTENFLRAGGKLGFNVNKTPNQSFKNSFHYNYQLGAFVQINFSRRFGVQPEVNFVQATAEQGNELPTIFNDAFRDGVQIRRPFNYLEIPVLINMNVGQSRHVKLQFGPAYNILLNKNEENIKNNTVTNLYKNGELSAIGGLWIQLPFINISGRYKMGLSKVTAADNSTSWKNQAFEFAVGFTL